MADYERQVMRKLRQAGCMHVRPGKGDHETWSSPVNGRHFTVKRHRMKSRHMANEVLKQAGLPKEF